MTGAMYSAISGLKSHMSKLSVIANNVSNVNTAGYKSQRAVFRDTLYTTYGTGSDGTPTTAGKNPSQVGYGSRLTSIDLNMSTATYTPGNAMDCMIYGDGFFLVGSKGIADTIDAMDPSSFKNLTLTRVGDFSFMADGYLADGNGSPVYGFLSTGTDVEGNPIMSDQLVPIRLPLMEKVAVSLAAADYGEEIEGDPTGDEGTDYKWTYVVRYPVAKSDDGTAAVALHDYTVIDEETNTPVEFQRAQLDSLNIDSKTGRITGTLKDTDQVITIGFLAIGNVTNPNGLTHTGNSYYTCAAGAGDMSISLLGGVGQMLGLTHVNGSLANTEDGGDDMELSRKSEIGSAGSSELVTGGLEASNVDLATEISEMITTQRGYQANTRIVTVTDTMLEELVNMKR